MLFFVFHECLAGYDVSLLIDLEKLPSAENEKGTNLFILKWFKAMIYRKLKGSHCSEPVKCRMPRVDLYKKGSDFPVTPEHTLGARSH